MTLPVTRKQYVAEKYLLGAGLTAVAWGNCNDNGSNLQRCGRTSGVSE